MIALPGSEASGPMNVCDASTYSRKGCDVESGGLNGRLELYYAGRAHRVKSLPAVSFLPTERCEDDDFVIGLNDIRYH
jgi:hypothetical protein